MRMIINTPACSIVAVDPGGTTGLAIHDGWSGLDYWDQLNSGTGDGIARAKSVVSRKSKAASPVEYTHTMETATAVFIVDTCVALGPIGHLVVEDFILGFGDPSQAGSSKREGLSPVRVTARLFQEAETRGLFNGDAWRKGNGQFLGVSGVDKRGLTITKKGEEAAGLPLAARLYMYKFGTLPTVGNVWGGSGWTWSLSGTQRKKAKICDDEALKAKGYWIPGRDHARDAGRHLLLEMADRLMFTPGFSDRLDVVKSLMGAVG